MLRATTRALAAATAVAAAACAATSFHSTWRNPAAEPLNFKDQKVCALIVSKEEGVRYGAEDALAREITKHGAVGIAAYTLVPKELIQDKEKAKEFLEKADVKGVVAMSTPYKLPDDPRLRHIDWIAKLVSYMPKSDEEPGSSWFDKEAWKDHISYPQNPVRSIGQLNQLLGVMRTALPDVRVPVLLMHSKDDHYVLPENIELLYADLINAADKTKLYVTGSGHVIPRDAARRHAFQSALEFIRRIELSKASI